MLKTAGLVYGIALSLSFACSAADRPPRPDLQLAALSGDRAEPVARTANSHFTAVDVKRVVDAAAKHQIPLPELRIEELEADTPAGFQRFLGMWSSEFGFNGSGRHAMVIIARINRTGWAEGYLAFSPPKPNSWDQNPAGYYPFAAQIGADGLAIRYPKRTRTIVLSSRGNLVMKDVRADGRISEITLLPLWRGVGHSS